MRDALVKIRMTAAAKDSWERSATDAGATVSDYVRRAVVSYRRGQTADVAAELIAVRQELNAIGNNLNQAIRRLHGTGEATAIEETLAEVRAAAAVVSEALRESRG